MRRFTKSKDGKERTDIRVTIRLSRDEIEDIKKAARRDKIPWREWLEDNCLDGLYQALLNEDGSYEQRYGKGDG